MYRISESVRVYAYLILSSQASARSSRVTNTASALTAQSAFLNNFENVINHRVDIREDIKHYQDIISYGSSKVDYTVEENIHMLSSNMNLNIRSGTVGYNNKILISDEKFSLGKNDKINAPAMKSHKYSKTNSLQGLAHAPNTLHKKKQKPQTRTRNGHNEEKLLWCWLWQVVLQYGICLDS